MEEFRGDLGSWSCDGFAEEKGPVAEGEVKHTVCILFLWLLSTRLAINLFKALKSFAVKKIDLPNLMPCQTCRLCLHKSPAYASWIVTVSLDTTGKMLSGVASVLGSMCLCEGGLEA